MTKHALFGLDYALINNKIIPIDLKTPVSGLCAFFKAKFPSTKSPPLFIQKITTFVWCYKTHVVISGEER